MALNCLLCEVNLFEYFTWLFDSLAEGWPARRALEPLAPGLAGQRENTRTIAILLAFERLNSSTWHGRYTGVPDLAMCAASGTYGLAGRLAVR